MPVVGQERDTSQIRVDCPSGLREIGEDFVDRVKTHLEFQCPDNLQVRNLRPFTYEQVRPLEANQGEMEEGLGSRPETFEQLRALKEELCDNVEVELYPEEEMIKIRTLELQIGKSQITGDGTIQEVIISFDTLFKIFQNYFSYSEGETVLYLRENAPEKERYGLFAVLTDVGSRIVSIGGIRSWRMISIYPIVSLRMEELDGMREMIEELA